MQVLEVIAENLRKTKAGAQGADFDVPAHLICQAEDETSELIGRLGNQLQTGEDMRKIGRPGFVATLNRPNTCGASVLRELCLDGEDHRHWTYWPAHEGSG